jgi:murein DD-endopeptidase MepM/ murein hydrolase activator NlpD
MSPVTLATLALLQVALAGAGAPGPSPSVKAVPARVRPGDAFLVVVRGALAPPSATVTGRALAFFQVPEGFAAVAGLPVETPAGRLPIAVTLPPAAGAVAPPRAIEGAVEVTAPAFAHRALEVEPRFVEPPPLDVARRIEEDRAAFGVAFAQPPSPPLFATPFAWPRRARVTARFGEQRTLNGVKPSQHYGLDLAGKVGARVAAANAGVVVLVRDCWASGVTVILWHGAGLYTTYFHLSRALVGKGAHVARGDFIGLVGKSGRVSGPHLHWGVRVSDLYVDPASVLRLPLGRHPK